MTGKIRVFLPSNTLMYNFTVFVKDDHELNPNYEIDSCEWLSFDDARRNIDPKILAGIFLNAYLDDMQNFTHDKRLTRESVLSVIRRS